MIARRLIMLRHGRTAWNAEGRFQGQLDPPLDEVGRAQAYEVAHIIAAMRPDLMVSSSLLRARETAEIISQVTGLPFAVDPRFRERGLGLWEGLTRDDVERQYPAEYAEWVAGQDVRRRGGETRDEVAERALAAIAELPEMPVTVVVSHGATAMAAVNGLLGIEQQVHPLTALANCHWTEVTRNPATAYDAMWRVRGHNLGALGAVVPLPAHPVASEATTDADA